MSLVFSNRNIECALMNQMIMKSEVGGGVTANRESLEELMIELFFCREDAPIEMKHLQDASKGGFSLSSLHKCARTALTQCFGSMLATMDQKKEACDKLVTRGLAETAVPKPVMS